MDCDRSIGMNNESEQHAGKIAGIIALALSALLFLFLLSATISQNKQTKITACEKEGKVYDEKQKTCRTKTTSEKFDEKCAKDDYLIIDDKLYSCAEIKRLGLEKAYIDNTITKHGDTLYERGTSVEIAAGKQAGKYCLSASDAWDHVGEKRCVVFHYEYMACSGGYCYLDEKKNYTSGFVAFFGQYNMYSWESFRNEYYNAGPILVCGTITTYQGHPQIKITNPSKQIVKHPIQSYGAYAYTCKAMQ